jgi:hypothetical protein
MFMIPISHSELVLLVMQVIALFHHFHFPSSRKVCREIGGRQAIYWKSKTRRVVDNWEENTALGLCKLYSLVGT